MQAMIFAAGMGTRLKPLTDTMPKALVPLCGKPLLELLLLKLKAAGFREVVINVHHFAGMIRDFVRSNGGWGMNIRFSDETDLLRETGGGIRYAAPLLSSGQPVLVHNVDIVSNLDLKEFYSHHRPDSLATLLVSSRKTSRYLLFDRNNCLAGWLDASSGEIKSPYGELRREPGQWWKFYANAAAGVIREGADRPSGDGMNEEKEECISRFLGERGLQKYAFAGVHVISPGIFPLLEEREEKFSIIDFYLSVARRHKIRAYAPAGLELIDVGKADSLRKAEDFCRIFCPDTSVQTGYHESK